MDSREILLRHKDTGAPIDRFTLFRVNPQAPWLAWTGDTICARRKQRRIDYADGKPHDYIVEEGKEKSL